MSNNNNIIFDCCSDWCKDCKSRWMAEWQLDLFGLEDANGHILDVSATFSANSENNKTTIRYKYLFCFLAWSLLAYCLISRNNIREFFLASLTIWVLSASCIYLTCSLWLSTGRLPLLTPCTQSQNVEIPSKWTRFVWMWFAIVAASSCLVLLLFWSLEYPYQNNMNHNNIMIQDEQDDDNGTATTTPNLHWYSYRTIMTHGGVAIMVFTDGLYINRIPVRLKHWIWTALAQAVYLTWTILHAIFLRYHHHNNHTYDVLNWKQEPLETIALTIGTIFILTPLVHIWIWWLSLFGRRYQASSPRRSKSLMEQEEDLEMKTSLMKSMDDEDF